MADDGSIKCAACPNHVCPDRDAYREHTETAWHKFNLNRRMMGNQVLTEEEYQAQYGNNSGQAAKKEEKTVEKPSEPAVSDGKVSVCIAFNHYNKKWSHKFLIEQGTTVMDLKRKMVKPSSPQEDVLAFSLKKGMLRMTHFETIDQDETFDFHFVGPEEGEKLLERDRLRKEREEAEALEREKRRQELEDKDRKLLEERQRQQAEQERQLQRKKEEEKEEEERSRRQGAEEAKREAEERQRRAKEEEEKEQRQKREQEERRRAAEAQREEERRRREAQEKEREERQREERLEAVRKHVERRREADEERRREAARKEDDKALRRSGGEEGQLLALTVHIDRDLELTSILQVPRNATVAAVKELLAKEDVTGAARPGDFGLCEPVFGAELGDRELISDNLLEVDVFMKPRLS